MTSLEKSRAKKEAAEKLDMDRKMAEFN
jgi:hypothetical protein